MDSFDALTCRADAHVLLHCGRQTRPPHRAPGEVERLVAPEVPPKRGGMELLQHSAAQQACSGNAQAVAARAQTVQELLRS